MRRELDQYLDRESQGVHAIQQELDDLYESVQRARTRAESSRQTAQAIRAQCQQTRYRRAIIRQGLHGEGGYGYRSPEGRPQEYWRYTGADRDGTPPEMFPGAHGTRDLPAIATPTGESGNSTDESPSAGAGVAVNATMSR
jgi:hypothetical protein